MLSGITDRRLGIPSEPPSKKRRFSEEHDKNRFSVSLPAIEVTRDFGTTCTGLKEARSMIKAECETLVQHTVCNLLRFKIQGQNSQIDFIARTNLKSG